MTQDIRLALRRLLKNPGFTLSALITLALGIGANTVIFSLVNGILLRPLPYPEPGRLVRVMPEGLYQKGVFLALRGKTQSLENIAAYTTDTGFNLTGSGDPERIEGSAVSAELFSVLGVNAMRGRTIGAGEDQAGQDQVVILSHALWQRSFGSDPAIVNRTITLNGKSREVIGIMPADFHFPSPQTQLWVPVHFDPNNWVDLWTLTPLRFIGRLRPESSAGQASAELRMLLPQIKSTIPWRMPDDWGENGQTVSLQQHMVGEFQSRFLILLGAVLLVLLIACVNVTNLMLARVVAQQKELALYTALGASRWRIMRQFLIESLFVTVLGGALGLLLAVYGLPLLVSALPADTPRLSEVVIDWRILGFASGLTILTGVVLGIVPAIKATAPDLQSALKQGGQRSTFGASFKSLTSILVMGEVALAVVLVVGAVLLVKSFWRLSQIDPGFRSDHVLTFRVTPLESLCQEPARCVALYDELLQRLRGLSGVEDAAAVNDLPLGETSTSIPLAIKDHPQAPNSAPPQAQMYAVSPEYTNTMKIPALAGRSFTSADRAAGNAGVVLINQAFAKRFWPGQEAIGKQIKPVFPKEWWTVVGVVSDMEARGFAQDPGLQFYVPYGAFGTQAAMNVAVRMNGDPASLAGSVRGIVASVDRYAPVSNIRTYEQIVSTTVATPRFTMWLLVAFMLLALLLGAVGIYGVITYSVSRRAHEIGIRMALGAQKMDVARLVMRQSFLLTFIGVIIGMAAALVVTRVMRSLLYQVSPRDPLAFLVVIILLGIVALLSSYLPARRATRVDPMITLRTEV